MQASNEIRDAWRAVMRTEDGETVIGHILDMCGYGEDAYRTTDRDTCYELGRRTVAHLIEAALGGIGMDTAAARSTYRDMTLREMVRNKDRREAERRKDEEDG